MILHKHHSSRYSPMNYPKSPPSTLHMVCKLKNVQGFSIPTSSKPSLKASILVNSTPLISLGPISTTDHSHSSKIKTSLSTLPFKLSFLVLIQIWRSIKYWEEGIRLSQQNQLPRKTSAYQSSWYFASRTWFNWFFSENSLPIWFATEMSKLTVSSRYITNWFRSRWFHKNI